MLESIGFNWAKLIGQELWDQRFTELVAFKKRVRCGISDVCFLSLNVLIPFICKWFVSQNKHCNVPTKSELGRWVSTQRSERKKGVITKKNEEKLNRIGFVW